MSEEKKPKRAAGAKALAAKMTPEEKKEVEDAEKFLKTIFRF